MNSSLLFVRFLGHINSSKPYRASRLAIFYGLVIVSAFSPGCSTMPFFSKPATQQPYELKLELLAKADTNLDARSRPSPIQVRVFVTSTQSQILTKSFEEIFDFNGVLIDPRPLSTVTMNPGQTLSLTLPANKSQKLIVIAAGYRDPYQSVWMASTVITPEKTVEATATIGTHTVTIRPETSHVNSSASLRGSYAEE